ncbi:hypothetical protein R1flu_010039 [Riccia fluitans]|uniref:RNase H type-1 domain-containing protein n=1 Tax=Riccia fluitans TaxID=41844 RepID=A0ABD1Z832_9MARC
MSSRPPETSEHRGGTRIVLTLATTRRMEPIDNPRICDPARGSSFHSRLPSDIVIFDPDSELSYLQFSTKEEPLTLRMKKDQVVIAIRGACRGNGTCTAKAAYGVFFGRASSHNKYGLLPEDEQHTSQNAEIYAARMVLDLAGKMFQDNPTVKGINLITGSSFLTKAMTDQIHEWLENWFVTSSRGPASRITNADAIRHLNQTIESLESGGLSVRFWLVRKDQNADADTLANLAFND